jgi:hypothetical protein
MSSSKFAAIILSLLFSFFLSCKNDIGGSKDVNPQNIYFDYKIWGEEGKNDITCLFRYHFSGQNGISLLLNEPSRVELDGEKIPPDSAKLSGVFYEIQKPIVDFTGKHTITFTGIDNIQYKEDFHFRPFVLKSGPPSISTRKNWMFQLEGLQPIDYIRVIVIDTSFASNGINEIDTVRNGTLVIQKEKLNNLVNGPVTMVLFKEEEQPIKNGTKRGGKLSITYGLKRQFELKE